jgi:hypothetical protein
MTEETRYDRRAFALAYLNAQHDWEARVAHQQVLMGLQELFDLTLDDTQLPAVHWGLFTSTVRSYFAITHPGEAGPDEATRSALAQIADLNNQSREAHLDVLEAVLAGFVGDKVFTSADLRAIGIDDTR